MARRPKKSVEAEADASEIEESLASAEANLATDAGDGSSLDEQGLACGGVLSAARVAQKLSTQEVAKQLRLSVTQIEALELDDYGSLPEATIVKGFIRNYAKLLKISDMPLLKAYAQLAPAKEDYSFALNPGINMKITEHRKSKKLHYFLMGLGLLVAGGLWFFYQSYVQKPSPVDPLPETVESLPQLALPMSERIENVASTQLEMPEQTQEQVAEGESKQELATSGEAAAEKLAEAETVNDEPEKTTESEPVVEPEEATDQVETSNDEPLVAGKTRLEFSATQETWLSVVNTSGREVYNKILYAGDRDVVDIRGPSQIVVGNAHGATLVVDGKPIDLAPYTRINVARVRLNR
ncbi:MAG: helix-turn-helix domain-containing protein [Methylophilaceae bacterium]